MSANRSCEQIVRFGKSMFDRGLTFGSSGNISARLEDGWLMSPTNVALDRLDEQVQAAVGDASAHAVEEVHAVRRIEHPARCNREGAVGRVTRHRDRQRRHGANMRHAIGVPGRFLYNRPATTRNPTPTDTPDVRIGPDTTTEPVNEW